MNIISADIYFKILISLIFSWLIVKINLSIFSKYLLDKPNKRSSHLKPIPRGGGISFALVTMFYFLLLKQWNILIFLPLLIIGLLDDLIKVRSILRFTIQSFTILGIFYTQYIFKISFFDNQYLNIISLIFLFLASVAIINFTNFMDGIDGLVAGCMIVIFTVISIKLDPNIFVIVGSLIGFLIWNWDPAKIFMGDIGSTYLGAFFVYSLTKITNLNDFLGILLVSYPLMADALICVLRRYFNGQNIFSAHNLHLYQRLIRSGWRHKSVSNLYILSTILIGFSYLYLNIFYSLLILSAISLGGIFLDKKIAYSFLLASSELKN